MKLHSLKSITVNGNFIRIARYDNGYDTVYYTLYVNGACVARKIPTAKEVAGIALSYAL